MCHHNFWLTHCIEELRNRILYLRYAHHVRTNSHDKSGFGIRHFECHVGAFLRNCISIQRCRRSEEMVDTFYRRFYGDLQHPQVFWGECLILFGIKLTQIRKWIFGLWRPCKSFIPCLPLTNRPLCLGVFLYREERWGWTFLPNEIFGVILHSAHTDGRKHTQWPHPYKKLGKELEKIRLILLEALDNKKHA